MQRAHRSTCLPGVEIGEPQRAEGATREHATYIILFESYMANTGDFLKDVKESGK